MTVFRRANTIGKQLLLLLRRLLPFFLLHVHRVSPFLPAKVAVTVVPGTVDVAAAVNVFMLLAKCTSN